MRIYRPKLNLWTQTLLVILMTSCSSRLEKRAAIDIGSGETKIRAYIVDKTSNKLVSDPLLQEGVRVSFEKSIKNNLLSEEVAKEGIAALISFKPQLENLKISKVQAVATGPFRKAQNAPQVIQKLSELSGFPIKIISQDEEAYLGFLAAVSKVHPVDIHKVAVLDIGGSTFQLTLLDDNQKPVSIKSSKSAIYAAEFAKKINKGKINPFGPALFSRLKQDAKTWPQTSSTAISFQGKKFLGIGSFFNKGMKPHFGPTLRSSAVSEYVTTVYKETKNQPTDAFIKSKFPNDPFWEQRIPDMAFLSGIMEHFGINEIEIVNANLAEGVILSSDFFPKD